jgi:hypothetical protein
MGAFCKWFAKKGREREYLDKDLLQINSYFSFWLELSLGVNEILKCFIG